MATPRIGNTEKMECSRLPWEVYLSIFDVLIGYTAKNHTLADSSHPLTRYSLVCKRWQGIFEKAIYRHMILEPHCIGQLGRFLQGYRRSLVDYIYVKIPIPNYRIRDGFYEPHWWDDHLQVTVKPAVTELYKALSTWTQASEVLTLDLNVYRNDDIVYYYNRGLRFDTNPLDLDLELEAGRRSEDILHEYDECDAYWISEAHSTFDSIDLDSSDYSHDNQNTPVVPAVRRFLLRRQTRCCFVETSANFLLGRLPKLDSIHYEFWDRDSYNQLGFEPTDGPTDVDAIVRDLGQTEVRSLVLFKDFNPDFDHERGMDPDWPRPAGELEDGTSDAVVGARLAEASLKLERLHASYAVDARYFFEKRRPEWVWERLGVVSLTSEHLSPASKASDVDGVLLEAGRAALQMPRLRKMEIWNGRCRLAALFCYEYTDIATTIQWRGTWKLKLSPDVVDAWKRVAQMDPRRELRLLNSKILDRDNIKSHGTAIRMLGLDEHVVHPVSLKQIEKEGLHYRYEH